jgi:hypothetical protein
VHPARRADRCVIAVMPLSGQWRTRRRTSALWKNAKAEAGAALSCVAARVPRDPYLLDVHQI